MSEVNSPPFASRLLTYTGVAVLLIAVTVGVRWSSFETLSTHFIGGTEGDAGLYVWLMRTFLADPLEALRLETPAFYPYSDTRAWSDNFILPSLVAWPFLKIGFPEPLVYNALLLAATFLNGWCTFLLTRTLGIKPIAGAFAAAAFTSTAYFTCNLGHPQLQFAFFLPLGLAQALDCFGPEGSFKKGLLLGVTGSSAFLTTVYYAVFLAFIVVFVFLALFIMGSSGTRRRLPLTVTGMAIGCLPCVFFLPAYLAVKQTFGERNLYEAYYFSATGLSYLSFSPWSAFYSKTSNYTHAEAYLGLGFSALLALVLLLWIWIRHLTVERVPGVCALGFTAAALVFSCNFFEGKLDTQLTQLFSWLAVCAILTVALAQYRIRGAPPTEFSFATVLVLLLLVVLLVSLGPLGNPANDESAGGVFSAIHLTVPGFDAIRAVSRLGIVVHLVVFVLGSAAMSLFPVGWLTRGVGVFLLTVFFLVEHHTPTYPRDAFHAAPQIFSRLPPAAGDQAVLVLPMTTTLDGGRVASWGDFARWNVRYMNWLSGTGYRTVNGYSGQRSKLMLDLPGVLQGFPDPKSLRTLLRIHGLRYVLVLGSAIPGFDRGRFESELASVEDKVKIVARDDSDLLVELAPLTFKGMEYVLTSRAWPDQLTIRAVTAPCNLQVAMADSWRPVDLQQSLKQSSTRVLISEEARVPLPSGASSDSRPRVVAMLSDCNVTVVR